MNKVIYFVTIAALVYLAASAAIASTQDSWLIESGPIDPKNYFGESVANGMIGITSSSSPFRAQKTLIYGAYEKVEADGVSCIVDTFNFVDLAFSIDGERIERLGQVSHFRQTLEMKGAVFTTTFDFKDKASITYKLRALRHLPYSALLEVSVVAKRSIKIGAISLIETPRLTLSQWQGDKDSSDPSLPLTSVETHDTIASSYASERDPRLALWLRAASAKSQFGRHDIAAAQGFVFDDPLAAPPLSHHAQGLTFTKTLPAGATYGFALVGSTLTSAHVEDPLNEARRLTIFAMIQGTQRLIAQHEHAWQELWKSDILIEGDDEVQRDVHSMLYHLYSSVREGTNYGIPPAGLTRGLNGYLGHISWDSDMWMYPALLALQPELARSMIEYRYDRLSGARKRARAHGYRGALFPWESAASGDEDSPGTAIGPELQHHTSADVAIAAWNYYRVTQDQQWLREKGYPLIRETADFWTSRVTRNGPGRYDITNVQAADEFAEDVDNNAFTNAAAKENLAIAQAAARILDLTPNPDWEHVRKNIPILKFPDGVTREHATYNGEKIKQGDVTLLAYPLKEITDRDAILRDLEYYYSRYDSVIGPSYSKSAFAILYQRLGHPQKAHEIFEDAYQPNKRPPFGVLAECPSCKNPYYITSAGGLVQALLFGFGGLEITDKGIEQSAFSKLPPVWKSLTVTGIGPREKTFVVPLH
jgi:protein-glucosylgalactosylhydroxylysine glucosidase